jgi:hypothetical protein
MLEGNLCQWGNDRQRMKHKSEPGAAAALTERRAQVVLRPLTAMRFGHYCSIIACVHGKIVCARHAALHQNNNCQYERERFHRPKVSFVMKRISTKKQCCKIAEKQSYLSLPTLSFTTDCYAKGTRIRGMHYEIKF